MHKPLIRLAGYQGAGSLLTSALMRLAEVMQTSADLSCETEIDVTAQAESAKQLFQSVEQGSRQICYIASGYLSARVNELGVLDLPFLDAKGSHESGASQWALKGPGIQDVNYVSVDGLAADFLAQWTANHASVPRGVDLFLASAQQLVGLPRTTSIQLSGGL
jgi:alpha-D-ribose 1-methylphosphonate 5-triphosphate synthase subunit PhnH